MSRQKVLQGLRQSIFHQGTPRSVMVIGKKTTPIYIPVRRTSFFADGAIAIGCTEPVIVCNGPRLKLLNTDGSVSWVPVSPETYKAAVVGRPFSEG